MKHRQEHYKNLLIQHGVPNFMVPAVSGLILVLANHQYEKGYQEGLKEGFSLSQPKQESWSKYNAG